MLAKVLVVDDDIRLQNLLSRFLTEQNFKVYTAIDFDDMQRQIQRNVFDMYLLDINLPKKNGLEICQWLRNLGDATPVIMLTARGEDVDRITGLEMGADDYLSKPFNPQELVARMRSIFRRVGFSASEPFKTDNVTIEFSGYVLDGNRQEIRYGEHIIPLSNNQYNFLKALAMQKGEAVSRTQLCHRVYGREHSPESRDIDMLVSSIRKLLVADKSGGDLIKTVRGIGYKLVIGAD